MKSIMETSFPIALISNMAGKRSDSVHTFNMHPSVYSFCLTIYLTSSSLFQLGDFWVAAKIVRFESVREWFSCSCHTNGCNKKLVLTYGFMECPKCKCKWGDGLRKYCLIVWVVGWMEIRHSSFWDRERSKLLGITTLELYTRIDEVRDVFYYVFMLVVSLRFLYSC